MSAAAGSVSAVALPSDLPTEPAPRVAALVEQLRAHNTDIFLSLAGYDETIAQTVHVRHAYKLDDIIPDVRFADVLESLEDGTRVLNYEHFHDLLPIETIATSFFASCSSTGSGTSFFAVANLRSSRSSTIWYSAESSV